MGVKIKCLWQANQLRQGLCERNLLITGLGDGWGSFRLRKSSYFHWQQCYEAMNQTVQSTTSNQRHFYDFLFIIARLPHDEFYSEKTVDMHAQLYLWHFCCLSRTGLVYMPWCIKVSPWHSKSCWQWIAQPIKFLRNSGVIVCGGRAPHRVILVSRSPINHVK